MLTTDEIRRFIQEDMVSERKRRAKEGLRYYEGDHDILQYRMFYYNADGVLTEDKVRANSRICHPFFTELVDQLAAYIVSFDENPIQGKATAEGLQDHLDQYFDDEFWSEMLEVITGANSKGFEYLYAYKNAEDRLEFQCADSMGVVEVRAKDTDDQCNYVIYWYVDRIDKDGDKIKRIEVHDKDQIWFYCQEDDGEIMLDEKEPINPLPNIVWQDKGTGAKYGDSLGFVPFWRLDNCKKQFSGLKPIKALIDDYDLMECGLSNNLQDFDKPIHLVRGFEGDNLDELQQNIMTKKVLGVDADGGLDILTVNVPYQARVTKAMEDEKNIYRFGMGFNSSQAGDGNITNVVIRSRYTLLELKAKKMISRIKKFLKPIVKVVLDEINEKNGTAYLYSDVTIDIKPVVMVNETENAQIKATEAGVEQTRINTLLSVADIIGAEEVMKLMCEILDIDFDDLKGQLDKLNEAQNTAQAEETLEGVMTDEQQAETGTEAILEQ